MDGVLGAVDWATASPQLLESGSVYLRGAINAEVCDLLLEARCSRWHRLAEEEGVVRQHGFGAFATVQEAGSLVSTIGAEIVLGVGCGAERELPPVPAFNEVSWSRYPAGRGHISAHRDPYAYGGIVAIVTLVGSATFRVWDGRVLGYPNQVSAGTSEPHGWTAAGGDLVLLRGNDWPEPGNRCPVHEALAPPKGERIIMTLRFNSRGAGAAYDS